MDTDAVQAEVLGRLLVLQQSLDAMPTEERIREFTVQGLMTVPGTRMVLIFICDPMEPVETKVAAIRAQWTQQGFVHPADNPSLRSDEAGSHYYPLAKPPHLFGFLIVHAEDDSLLKPYIDVIGNIANSIAGVLDGRLHHSLLSATAEQLLKRSRELQASNAKLQTEVQEREQAEAAQSELARELARSNAELEQMAYVASHDLQEPLRMVASYLQLLERKYEGQLDAEAHEFIAFAVDGAKRMQALINDLLSYSRAGAALASEPTESARALDTAVASLRMLIAETGTRIERGRLPRVMAAPASLTQLFQNLIANAIKFRRKEAPRIAIWAEPDGEFWRFAVQDNGIGVAPEYHERIFVMFQRLHRRSEYPGTGIGLAICKKIVERHGGRIWLESALGEGATFRFTLKDGERHA
jgi:signal transduction histidine kinase